MFFLSFANKNKKTLTPSREREVILLSFLLVLFLSFANGDRVFIPKKDLCPKETSSDYVARSFEGRDWGNEKMFMNFYNRVPYEKENVTAMNFKAIFKRVFKRKPNEGEDVYNLLRASAIIDSVGALKAVPTDMTKEEMQFVEQVADIKKISDPSMASFVRLSIAVLNLCNPQLHEDGVQADGLTIDK